MKENQQTHVHDKGYKSLLDFSKILQQLVEGYVEGDWQKSLDFSKGKKLKTAFIAKELEKRESDILYEIPLLETGENILVYILLEHQSTIDHSMAFRLLRYTTDIWTTYVRDYVKESERKSKKFKLPPLCSIVLYNGANKWSAPTSLKELIQKNAFFDKGYPNLEYYLIDISQLDKEKLKKANDIISQVFLFENKLTDEEIVQTLKQAGETVFKEEDVDIWKAFIEWIKARYKNTGNPSFKKFLENLNPNELSKEEIRKMLETQPEKVFHDTLEKGAQQANEKTAANMLKKGMEVALIVEVTELPEERVLALKENLSKKTKDS